MSHIIFCSLKAICLRSSSHVYYSSTHEGQEVTDTYFKKPTLFCLLRMSKMQDSITHGKKNPKKTMAKDTENFLVELCLSLIDSCREMFFFITFYLFIYFHL